MNETVKIAELSNCPVVISGGVSSISDIKKAKDLNNKKIEGIIVGKAIYDGDINLDELAKDRLKWLQNYQLLEEKLEMEKNLGFSERARAVNKGLLPSKAKKRKNVKK